MNLALSLEQEFNLQAYSQQVQHLTLPEAQEMLISLIWQNIAKDNAIKELMKNPITPPCYNPAHLG